MFPSLPLSLLLPPEKFYESRVVRSHSCAMILMTCESRAYAYLTLDEAVVPFICVVI